MKSTNPLSLRHNFSWMLASNVIYGACQWAMLAALAKLGTPEMVGRFALALAVTAPIILFANLSLRNVQATDVKREYRFRDYLGLRLLALALAVAAIGAVTGLARYGGETAAVIGWVAVAKIFDSLSDVAYGLLQQHERMDNIGISRIIQGVLQLVTLSAVTYLTGSLIWATCVMALASGLVTAFYDLPITARMLGKEAESEQGGDGDDPRWLSGAKVRRLRPAWHGRTLSRLTRLSLPLGVVAVLGSVNIGIPRYFLEHYEGTRQVGIFSAMWSILYPMGIVLVSVANAIMPRLARYYAEDIASYKRVFRLLLLLAAGSGVAGVLVALLVGRPLLTLLFRPEYAAYPDVFAWIMAAAGVSYIASVLQGGISAARYFRGQPVGLVISSVVIAAGCFWLVPRYHLQGAAWAYFGGMVAWMVSFGVIALLAVRDGERRGGAAHSAEREADRVPAPSEV